MTNWRWGYAINQWRNMEVDLARKDQIASALKVISVSGFTGVEITEMAIGGRAMVEGLFGSTRQFLDFARSCGVACVSSFFTSIGSGSAFGGGHAAERADHAEIVAAATEIAGFLKDAGGSCLVARPMAPYWKAAPITGEKIRAAAECWNAVGKATADVGIHTALHFDFLGGVRSEEQIDQFLSSTDGATVGIALDTAELTIAGLDALAFYKKHHARVRHLHFKDAVARDTLNEYKEPGAEMDYWPTSMIVAGAKQGIERWFYEMGTPGGLVDFPGLVQAMKHHGYDGWVVVESDQSPHVEESVMLNGWYRRHVLSLA